MRIILAALLGLAALAGAAAFAFETEPLDNSPGSPEITFIGHGTLMFRFGGKVIHVDPWGRLADYGTLPKADLVLVTHEHGDHLDIAAIEALRKDGTVVLASAAAARQIKGAVTLKTATPGPGWASP